MKPYNLLGQLVCGNFEVGVEFFYINILVELEYQLKSSVYSLKVSV